MNFAKAFKVFELNLLRQAGVAVTPQQLGLKSDPIADLQAKNTTGAFSSLLGKMGSGSLQGFTPPVPPTPPADATDAAAQAKYQQDLLAYQNNFQLYNQRFMQLMLNQIQSLQQAISANNQQNNSSGNSSGDLTSSRPIGVGGILGD
ncbi:MAG: hypothetical protein K0Q50_1338 [Vampirovibrio sp.]|jgi:hypothetical protein|nr:hypothetical protein [Vampirovibrio sp.]